MTRGCPVALVVSADRQMRRLICASLGDLGCATLGAASHDEGIDRAARGRLDFVVVDVSEADAFESALVRGLRSEQPSLRVLYLIGRASPLFRRGPGVDAQQSLLRRPFRVYDLCNVVAPWIDEDTSMLAAAGISLN